jgi:phosphocarrier protein HPr
LRRLGPAEIIRQIELVQLFVMSKPMSAKTLPDDNSMTKEFLVSNKLGIHARPAALFVKTANRFNCDIFVEKDGEKVNGKSIMGLMMLAAGPAANCSFTPTDRMPPKRSPNSKD